MCKVKKAILIFTAILIVITAVCSVACTDDIDNTEKTKDDYDVAGIWHAQATWHEDSPYNYNGYTFKLDIWFDFKQDGTLKTKRTLSINGYSFEDSLSDWTIVNATWSVEGNVIKLSSGKQFVIVDDEFNDTYPDPQMILRYRKELSE